MLKIINKHNEGETLISILKDYYTFVLIKFTTLVFYCKQTLQTLLKTNEK